MLRHTYFFVTSLFSLEEIVPVELRFIVPELERRFICYRIDDLLEKYKIVVEGDGLKADI